MNHLPLFECRQLDVTVWELAVSQRRIHHQLDAYLFFQHSYVFMSTALLCTRFWHETQLLTCARQLLSGNLKAIVWRNEHVTTFIWNHVDKSGRFVCSCSVPGPRLPAILSNRAAGVWQFLPIRLIWVYLRGMTALALPARWGCVCVCVSSRWRCDLAPLICFLGGRGRAGTDRDGQGRAGTGWEGHSRNFHVFPSNISSV